MTRRRRTKAIEHAPITLDRALKDPKLLAAALGDLSTWTTWFGVLKAAYHEPLDQAEREAFDTVAGGRSPPTSPAKELVVVASRRSGKGRMAGALAVYVSAMLDHSSVLAPGETGYVACISPTRAQATIVQKYALAYLRSTPKLSDQIASVTADEITLVNGNVIATLSSDYRTMRGRTLLLAILDEASFLRDESSSMPDIEAARALLPGLTTTRGMLVILSSPYARRGLLYQRHKDHFGRDSDVLVVAGPSLAFNPTLDTSVIESAREADPMAALSEWDGEFRNDLSQFLDDATIDAAVDHSRPAELPPIEKVTYFAFTDMSGGGQDASTICIVHRDGDRIIADAIRGRRGDPNAAVKEFAALAKQYGCRSITGDNYAKEWVAGGYRNAGLEYRRSRLVRSDLYLEGLPLFTRGLVSIPANAALLRELRLLERRTARSGKDSVDHGVGGHDDHANSLFGAMYLAAKTEKVTPTWGNIGAFTAPRTGFAGAPGFGGTPEDIAWLAAGGCFGGGGRNRSVCW
jgi:hypothetical protein